MTGSSWVQHQIITGVTANDNFGYAVSVDGTNALIGAIYANDYRGAAYIYTYNAATSQWIQNAVLSSQSEQYSFSYFGYSVSLSGDQALVGSPYELNDSDEQVGAAYLYTNDGSYWNLTKTNCSLHQKEGFLRTKFAECFIPQK